MAARGFPYPDLRSFLGALERAGELRRVTVPVDPTLEISEVVTRTVRAGGPALLFEQPTRGEMPVAINLFGTERRTALALGVESLNEIGDRIGALVKPELPVGWSGIREGLGKVLQLKSVPPKKVKTAPCQEVVLKGDDVDLNRLPGLQVWPGDGGIFHNFGLTHTKHPETGKRNLGLQRLQQHSRNTLGMHWQIHKDSTAHHAVAERLGRRLPVAVAIGCDPVVSYAATAPLPVAATKTTAATMKPVREPWIVGVTGASGTPYASAVLRGLLDASCAVDLIASRAARLTILDETGRPFRD